MKKWRRLSIGLVALAMLVALPATASAHNGDNGHRVLQADLSGDQEVPPVDTDGSGMATFRLDKATTEMTYRLRFRNVDGALGVAGAHIHCGAAGANGPVAAFLAAPVAGGVDGKVNITGVISDAQVIPTDCGADLAGLVDSMRAGNTYVNVHSLGVPSGELRGQIYPLGRN